MNFFANALSERCCCALFVWVLLQLLKLLMWMYWVIGVCIWLKLCFYGSHNATFLRLGRRLLLVILAFDVLYLHIFVVQTNKLCCKSSTCRVLLSGLWAAEMPQGVICAECSSLISSTKNYTELFHVSTLFAPQKLLLCLKREWGSKSTGMHKRHSTGA